MAIKSLNQDKYLQSSVAMTLALISWGMLFATLFLGYFLVRFNSPVWPPVEIQDLPQLLPFLSTFVLALSSVTYYLMEKKALVNEKTGKIFWSITFALGLGFLVLQWMLWDALKASGILVANGMVPSMVYVFSWLHAGHVVLALIGLGWLAPFIFYKRKSLSELKLMNVGKFWHFLGVIWLLIYLMMFVL